MGRNIFSRPGGARFVAAGLSYHAVRSDGRSLPCEAVTAIFLIRRSEIDATTKSYRQLEAAGFPLSSTVAVEAVPPIAPGWLVEVPQMLLLLFELDDPLGEFAEFVDQLGQASPLAINHLPLVLKSVLFRLTVLW